MNAPMPPPPPPPPAPSAPSAPFSVPHNGSHCAIDKSQLLADICKGTTLRKTTTMEKCPTNAPPFNSYDNQIQSTKDLLQAELCSTLKRRKNVPPIIDPPKYQYPRYEDELDSKISSTTNSCDIKTDMMKSPINAIKPIPVIPSKLSSTDNTNKLSNGNDKFDAYVQDSNATIAKPLISHGKPNFTLPRKTEKKALFEQKTNDGNQYQPVFKTPMTPMTSSSLVKSANIGMDRNLNQSSNMNVTIINKSTEPISPKTRNVLNRSKSIDNAIASSPPPLPAKLPSTRLYITRTEEPKTNDNDTKKLFISHGKPNFVVPSKSKSKIIIKTSPPRSTKEKCENYLEVKIKSLKPQKSIDDTLHVDKKVSNDIEPAVHQLESAIRSLKSFKSVDDTIDDAIPIEHNELHRALTKLRSIDDSDGFSRTPNWSGRSTPASELSADSGNVSPPPSTFGKTITQENHTSYSNFEQKTVVSFSKDLIDAPNRYPESIKVTKTISSHTTSTVQQTVFNNIKFVIDDQGQVMRNNY